MRDLSLRTGVLDFPRICSGESSKRIPIWGAGNSALRNDRVHVFRWSHIEGWIFDPHTVRHHLFTRDVGDFSRIALLNRYLAAVGRIKVDGGDGSGNIKRDAVLFCQDGDGVSADLVGDVSIGGDAV